MWNLLIPLFICLLFLLFFICKNYNTYAIRHKILNAIHDYRMMVIINRSVTNKLSLDVDFNDMEDYFTTLLRFWDWGYKNILTKERYEIIKDYIK